MRWLVDLIQALLGRRTPEQGAAVVLPSDAAAEPVAATFVHSQFFAPKAAPTPPTTAPSK